jgi:hypothetical protein
MDILESFIYTIDMMLDTKRKRHVIGDILLSAAFLFGGLAVTAMTIKD